MKIRVHVSDDRGKPWTEDYDLEDSVDPVRWARDTVKKFNDTLRPHEQPRKVLKVERLHSAADVHRKHDWIKISVMTQSGVGSRGSFDRMRCEACGVTGKRYGLGQNGVKRDSEFRGNAFQFCDTATALLEKRKAKA